MNPSRKILIVEGVDDEHVVGHLQDRCLPSAEFEIDAKGGIDNVLKSIGPEIKVPGRVAVGILVDANNNLNNRWRAVSDRLKKVDIPTPAALPRAGAIIGEAPRVGVWAMPDNRSTGALEDFVKKMIPDDDPVWPLARKFIRDIPEDERKFTPGKRSKAELRAWLATRETPGPMGTAIGIGDLKTDGKLCIDFLKWLENLFE